MTLADSSASGAFVSRDAALARGGSPRRVRSPARPRALVRGGAWAAPRPAVYSDHPCGARHCRRGDGGRGSSRRRRDGADRAPRCERSISAQCAPDPRSATRPLRTSTRRVGGTPQARRGARFRLGRDRCRKPEPGAPAPARNSEQPDGVSGSIPNPPAPARPGHRCTTMRSSQGPGRAFPARPDLVHFERLVDARLGAAQSLSARCGSRLDESALVGDDDEPGAAACVESERSLRNVRWTNALDAAAAARGDAERAKRRQDVGLGAPPAQAVDDRVRAVRRAERLHPPRRVHASGGPAAGGSSASVA